MTVFKDVDVLRKAEYRKGVEKITGRSIGVFISFHLLTSKASIDALHVGGMTRMGEKS